MHETLVIIILCAVWSKINDYYILDIQVILRKLKADIVKLFTWYYIRQGQSVLCKISWYVEYNTW